MKSAQQNKELNSSLSILGSDAQKTIKLIHD